MPSTLREAGLICCTANSQSLLHTELLMHLRCATIQCSFTEHRNFKVVYRRYASLFFLVGIDEDEVHPCSCCALAPCPAPAQSLNLALPIIMLCEST